MLCVCMCFFLRWVLVTQSSRNVEKVDDKYVDIFVNKDLSTRIYRQLIVFAGVNLKQQNVLRLWMNFNGCIFVI